MTKKLIAMSPPRGILRRGAHTTFSGHRLGGRVWTIGRIERSRRNYLRRKAEAEAAQRQKA